MNGTTHDHPSLSQARPCGTAYHRGYVGDVPSGVRHSTGHGSENRVAYPMDSHRKTWAVQPDSFEVNHPVLFGAICTIAACAVFFGWPYFIYAVIKLFG